MNQKSPNKRILPDLGKLSPFSRCAAKKPPVHPSRKCERYVQGKIMKILILFLVLLTLVGCSSESEEASDAGPDGVWKLYMQTETYDAKTGEFVRTSMRENKFIFIEEVNGQITYHECDQSTKMIGQLTDTSIHILDSMLLKIGDNVYQNNIDRFENNQTYTYTTLATLRKIRNASSLDLGQLEIDGPISISETDSVCAFNSNIRNSDWKNIGLRVPYFDQYLQFNLVYTDQLSIGNYDWDDLDQDSPIITVFVTSRSDEFYSVAGTYELFPEQASFEIKNITDNSISGKVVFNDLGGQPFSIAFAADLLDLEP